MKNNNDKNMPISSKYRREQIFLKYGIKTTNVKKTGACVIMSNKPIILKQSKTEQEAQRATSNDEVRHN